jgi:hypothetical protein
MEWAHLESEGRYQEGSYLKIKEMLLQQIFIGYINYN